MALLDGRAIILTGAGSSVGRAAAPLLLAEGAALVLVDRDPARIPALDPARTLTLAADLTIAAACEDMVAAAEARFSSIAGIANTFGIDPPGARTTEETSEADFDHILLVNLKAVFLVCRAVLPALRRHGGGAIVNIASQGALLALPGMTAYGVSKAGVLQLTRQIAADHGREGIRANCICPSGLESPSLDRAAVLNAAQRARRAEVMAAMAPLGRICTPLDVARAMLFLLSDLSGFTTGAALPVEGGGTATLHF